MTQPLNDINIAGTGSFQGGKFNHINISGMGKITSDVEANSLQISGMGRVEGSAVVGSVQVNGTGKIHGSLDNQTLKNNGTLKILGNLKTGRLENRGTLTVIGSGQGERLESYGFIKFGSDVEMEEFICDGSFAIQGLLNANSIRITINGSCYSKEIGGEDIHVTLGKSISKGLNWLWKLFFNERNHLPNRLKCELIEGNTVSVENTNANTLRGDKVKIGPDCQIDLVEYSESLEVHPSSTIKNQVKIQRRLS